MSAGRDSVRIFNLEVPATPRVAGIYQAGLIENDLRQVFGVDIVTDGEEGDLLDSAEGRLVSTLERVRPLKPPASHAGREENQANEESYFSNG